MEIKMALADYDTSVEKIAALKAAQFDPNICNSTASNFTTDDIIYILATSYLKINNVAMDSTENYGDFYVDCYKVLNNINIETNYPIIYIKDSDIVYSEPITTYQDRLAKIFEAIPITIGLSDNFTSGVNGSILIAGNRTSLNGVTFDWNTVWFKKFAIPAGITISTYSSFNSFCTYFDVPADW